MEFKGMNKDTNPSLLGGGFWRHAKNVVFSPEIPALLNEPGFDLKGSLPTGFMYRGTIPIADGRIVAFVSNEDGAQSIGVVSLDGVYSRIVYSNYLELFDSYSTVTGTYYKNAYNETIVIWTDGINPPGILNIDRPVVSGFVNSSNSKLLNLFPTTTVPIVSSASVQENGGSLRAGSYQFFISYGYGDGSSTGFIGIGTNPIPITLGKFSDDYRKVDGSGSGTVTSKSLTIKLNNLDTIFDEIYLGVLFISGSETVAKKYGPFPKSLSDKELEIILTGSESNESITIEELIVGYTTFDRVASLKVANNKLYAGNLYRDIFEDFQEAACGITVKWNFDKKVSLDGNYGSYKDGAICLYDKGFMPDEVYALYVAFILKDGSVSPAFHIPGREVSTAPDINDEPENVLLSDLDITVDYPELASDADINGLIKYFHTRDTAAVDGTMGYWENIETYPSDFPVVAMRGTPVRHHKMPSLGLLINSLGPTEALVEPTPAATASGDAIRVGYDNTLTPTGTSNPNPTSFSYANGKVTFLEDCRILISSMCNFSASVDEYSTLTTSTELKLKRGTEAVRVFFKDEFEHTNLDAQVQTFNFNYGIEETAIRVKAGDVLEFNVSISGELLLSITALGYGVEVIDEYYGLTYSGSLFGRVLGLELSNINIPESVADKVSGVTFMYAKRRFDNSTVISQSLYFNGADSPLDMTKYARFHGPDLMAGGSFPSAGFTHAKITAFTPKNVNLFGATQIYSPPDNSEDIVRKVVSYKYNPLDLEDLVPSHLYLEFDSAFSETADHYKLITLYSLKLDAYKGYSNQSLVCTGKVFPISSAVNLSADRVMGGDTFLGDYTLRVFTGEFVSGNSNSKQYSFLTYSALNVPLRESGTQLHERHYYGVFGYIFTNESLYSYLDSLAAGTGANEYDNFLRIPFEYSRINDTKAAYPAKEKDFYNLSFPYRIAGSAQAGETSTGENYRRFMALDYHDLEKSVGDITHIELFQDTLIIFTTKTVLKVAAGVAISTDEGEVYVSAGELFRTRPVELIPSDNSIIGCKHSSSVVKTPIGVIGVSSDDALGKVFLISDSINIMSNSGMANEFRNKFDFEINSQIKGRGLQEIRTTKTDGPGISCGYDDRYNRVLITKRDFRLKDPTKFKATTAPYSVGSYYVVDHKLYIGALNPDIVGGANVLLPANFYSDDFENIGVTYSFSLMDTGFCVSEHSYLPALYTTVGNKLHAISYGNLFKVNSGTSGIFMDSVAKKSFVDFIFGTGDNNCILESVKWKTTCISEGLPINDKTIDKFLVYSQSKCSGYKNISNLLTLKVGNVYWNFNAFNDLSAAGAVKFIDDNNELIAASIDQNKSWHLRSRITGDWFIIRLEINPEVEGSDVLSIAIESVDPVVRLIMYKNSTK